MSIKSRAALAFVLLLTPCLFAQYRATLQGVVTDPSGAVVPQANVTLVGAETSARSKLTNDSGFYSIAGLAPGKYSLTVDKAGFTKQSLSDVEIRSEQAQNQNVQLSVSSGTVQTVTVSSTSDSLIDTETATIGGTLSGAQIQNLPTFGRDPFQSVDAGSRRVRRQREVCGW